MFSVILLIVFIVLILQYVRFRIANKETYDAEKQFHGPPTLPFFGNALPFLFKDSKSIFELILELSSQYDRFFRVWFMGRLNLIVNDCQDAEVILSSTTQIDKGEDYEFTLPWIGYGLLTSTGNRWRKHRKIITPTFHFKILEQFIDVFNRNGIIMCEKLQNEVGKEPFNIYNYVQLAALDNIYESAMGVNMNVQRDSNSEYVRAVKDMCRVINTRIFWFGLRSELLFRFSKLYEVQKNALKILHSTTENMIKQRRKEIALRKELQKSNEEPNEDDINQKKRLAFLDLLLESAEGSQLSDDDIRQEVDTFMFEGHDTITSGLSFALWALANHPEVQEKVYQEQQEIFGDSDRAPTLSDIQEMKYLERTLKESQRLYPSVPFISRGLNDRVELPGGYFLPKGTQVTIQIFLIHRNPKYWKNPNEFNPDNFTPEAIQHRNPYCYIPFSAGSRNCIGQKYAMLEMKATVSKIIRQYKLLPSPYEKDKLQMASELVLMSVNGFNIKIESRK